VWGAIAGDRGDNPAAVAEQAFARQLAHWADRGFGLWAAIPNGADEPVGWIGAWHQDIAPALDGDIEIGWGLRRPWWGRGLATEGARVTAEIAFEHLSPRRLISLIHPQNSRSQAVAARLGMRHTSETHHRDGLVLRVYSLDAPTG
jgi:RimJ/RimL family protein N-acetyltransferase